VDLVAGLRQPEAYPWRPDTVKVVETHISWVFLAGDKVVKIKRPVAYGFVDHTSMEARHQSCLDEVRLNRRLTDGVYLDVVPIVQSDSGYRVGGAGHPIEWATLMRRLPASGMLDALLAAGDAPPDLAAQLACRLIPFHRDRAPSCGGTADVAAAATAIVIENLDELGPFARRSLGPIQFDLVATAVRQFVATRDELLRARAAAGWIRDGHGDLRAEHVCLEPGGVVQIFDCVEFNREVRCADVASDLAFLLMDLTRLGASEIATSLLVRYREAGLNLPDELLRFYTAHRALVRAKIAGLELPGSTREEAARYMAEATDYLDLASAAALSVQPVLVAMTGFSGTGKSTVARRLARALGARLLASDVVRKELAGIEGPAPAAWGEGLYRPEWTRATYDRLFALAEVILRAGMPVVLDASFLATEQRAGAAAVAAQTDAQLVLVETICDEETVAARLATRTMRGDSPSDATLATFRRQLDSITPAPPRVPDGALSIQIDTTSGMVGAVDAVIGSLATGEIILPVVPITPQGKVPANEPAHDRPGGHGSEHDRSR
jgi:aminoglycoside phosphotransferase family enzyme/predicted kinase